jgi:hypothetical protein
MDLSALLFIGVAVLLIVAAIMVVIQAGFARLESSIGIMGDGIPVGKVAPSWHLPDLYGVSHGTPTQRNWQFLIFADHSLGGFPLVVAGMHRLSAEEHLEVILLSRDSPEFCAAMVRGLDLQVPVVHVGNDFYHRFRIRVMPFGFLINPIGIVRWAGLVSSEEQMKHVWHLAYDIDHENEVVRR